MAYKMWRQEGARGKEQRKQREGRAEKGRVRVREGKVEKKARGERKEKSNS